MKKILKEKFSLKENVTIVLRDKNGKIKPIFDFNSLGKFLMNKFCLIYKIPLLTGLWKKKICVENQVTNVSFSEIVGLVGDIGSKSSFKYIAIGEGTTGALATDTALETEITTNGGERAVVVPTSVTTTLTNDTLQINNTFSFTASFGVSEAGIFNDPSAGTMLSRVVRTAVPVIATDNLEITWKFKFA